MKISIKIPNFVKTTEALTALSTALAALGAAALQTRLVSDRLEKKYADIAEREIAEAKVYYSRFNKTGDYEDPITAATALGEDVASELVERLGYVSRNKTPTASEDPSLSDEEQVEAVLDAVDTVEKVVENRRKKKERPPVAPHPFDENNLDPGPTVKPPTYSEPYVITEEEFQRNELDFEQVMMEYFAEDDQLADERGKPVNEETKLLGDGLEHFGFKTGSRDIVHVRNEELGIDFEVRRVSGSYADQVAGFQHSEPKVKKFREGRAT